MADDDFLGMGPLVQFALIAGLGVGLAVAGLLTSSSVDGGYNPLLFGAGVVMVVYAAVGGGWTALVEALGLDERAQIAIILAAAVVLIATNTVGAGVVQLVAGVVLLLYGGGLGISHLAG
jgi:hypothetical protein